VNLAIILDKEGKSNEAQGHYQDALKSNPKDSKIFHNMGINLKRAGKLDDALAHYKQAMDLDPANPMILYNAGILHNIRVRGLFGLNFIV